MMVTVKVTAKVTTFEEQFKARVAGVTHRNPNGVNRQSLLRKCSAGEVVGLRREPENPYDRFAIVVLNANSQVLGYIPAGDRRLAEHIDRGGETRATIVAITGGPNIFQKLLGLGGKSYGCLLNIVKRDFDWKAVKPWLDANSTLDKLVKASHRLEKDSPDDAIAQYRDAIVKIMALDSNGSKASAWRTVKYPIDRPSLVLNRQGRNAEALAEIERWRQYADPVGVADAERASVSKREARLVKAISD
jgi:hypothetical protein